MGGSPNREARDPTEGPGGEMVEVNRSLKLKKRKRLLRLKRTIAYKGPDPDRQFAALDWLARTLGYQVFGIHEKIIRHQNLVAYGDRDADMILGFRGLGKSTIGTITRCIKYIIDDPNVRILIVSDSEAAANRFLREIRSHLQHNEDLVDMFGTFFYEKGNQGKGDGREVGRWREGFATIAQRTDKTISEPTIQSLGVGMQAASYHFDAVFVEDLVTVRNSRTPTQRKGLAEWHGSTLIGCTLEHTKVHYLGTRYYPNDQYEVLERGTDGKGEGVMAGGRTLCLPALVEDPKTGEETSSFPERYSLEKFNEMRSKMGRYHFNAQMQQDTRTGEGLIFKYQDFRWYQVGTLPDDLNVFCYFDLAAKKTDEGAFFAACVIGVTSDQSRIYLIDTFRERAGMKRQRELVLDVCNHHEPIAAGIEAVAMQAGFAEEIRDGTMLPIELDYPETDKVMRAYRVANLVESGKVFLPDRPDNVSLGDFVDEVTAFPNSDFKDFTDAFVGVLTLAMYGDWSAGTGIGLATGYREAATGIG